MWDMYNLINCAKIDNNADLYIIHLFQRVTEDFTLGVTNLPLTLRHKLLCTHMQ